MKKKFIIGFLLLVNTCFSASFAIGPTNSELEEIISRDVYADETIPFVRSIKPLQILLDRENQVITVLFNNPNIGDIDIQLQDGNNRILYKESVNSSVKSFSFDLSEFGKGRYTISVLNGNAHCWIGCFSL